MPLALMAPLAAALVTCRTSWPTAVPQPTSVHRSALLRASPLHCRPKVSVRMTEGESAELPAGDEELVEGGKLTVAEAEEIGNLVADDEYLGLGMEIAELVRISIKEELKTSLRDFIGKDEYKIGDISKELDSRIKDEVAKMRSKEEYELGDLTLAVDAMAREYTAELTGKPDADLADLSIEIDKRVKGAVMNFTGKDTYTPGDLSTEIDQRVKDQIMRFTGKETYEFGDLSRELNERRKGWMRDYLGKDPSQYEFGDLTKAAVSKFTGKSDYAFGDVTKAAIGKLFGPRKRSRDA